MSEQWRRSLPPSPDPRVRDRLRPLRRLHIQSTPGEIHIRPLLAPQSAKATRRLGERFELWQSGRITFGEFDSSVKGWFNHVRYADTWGLRGHVMDQFVWGPGKTRPVEKNFARASRGSDQRTSDQ